MVAAAGGLGDGDLPPIIDVELGGDNANSNVSDVVDTATAWAEAVQGALGRKPMLYRSNTSSGPATTSHMGCGYPWAKRYNDALDDGRYSIANVGWSEAAMWQYTDGSYKGVPAGYPVSAPGGLGAEDHNVFLYGGGSSFAAVRALIADSSQT